MTRITIGTMDAYLAEPGTEGRHPGVILAHQLFGVTSDVRAGPGRDVC